jgi:hypothetical protein
MEWAGAPAHSTCVSSGGGGCSPLTAQEIHSRDSDGRLRLEGHVKRAQHPCDDLLQRRLLGDIGTAGSDQRGTTTQQLNRLFDALLTPTQRKAIAQRARELRAFLDAHPAPLGWRPGMGTTLRRRTESNTLPDRAREELRWLAIQAANDPAPSQRFAADRYFAWAQRQGQRDAARRKWEALVP